jgi:hypothetical protein
MLITQNSIWAAGNSPKIILTQPLAEYSPGCTVLGVAVGVGVSVSVGNGVGVPVAVGGGGNVAVDVCAVVAVLLGSDAGLEVGSSSGIVCTSGGSVDPGCEGDVCGLQAVINTSVSAVRVIALKVTVYLNFIDFLPRLP